MSVNALHDEARAAGEVHSTTWAGPPTCSPNSKSVRGEQEEEEEEQVLTVSAVMSKPAKNNIWMVKREGEGGERERKVGIVCELR